MVKRILILAMTLSLAIAFCGCDFLKDVADSSIIVIFSMSSVIVLVIASVLENLTKVDPV